MTPSPMNPGLIGADYDGRGEVDMIRILARVLYHEGMPKHRTLTSHLMSAELERRGVRTRHC
jgi:hypothetical protein